MQFVLRTVDAEAHGAKAYHEGEKGFNTAQKSVMTSSKKILHKR